MCGIAACVGNFSDSPPIGTAVHALRHRGPDASRIYVSPTNSAALAHTRLSILDLSPNGTQPMSDPSARYHLIFNGEIYNFIELRNELADRWNFRTRTDTEVLLALLILEGESALHRLVGMFAFVFWDDQERCALVARDRFGVKPCYFHLSAEGRLSVASEIKALHALGVPRRENERTWAHYLAHGASDDSHQTFWDGIQSLAGGELLRWRNDQVEIRPWYDLATAVGEDFDRRSDDEVGDEYFHLLLDSVRLRFRSDVPVGINLSGGLDSSLLLGLVRKHCGASGSLCAFTFTTGDPNYDELPWVNQLLAGSSQQLVECRLHPSDVPALADSVTACQDEPFGGLPTLAYARLFEMARERGVIVLLDGQGMDEQWAGYDYYRNADHAHAASVQGTRQSPVRPECLHADFAAMAQSMTHPRPFSDTLRNLQYRDLRYSKIPRVLRFNDRVSMRSSTELREPFLDHRLVELACRQPSDRKLRGSVQKFFLRELARRRLHIKLAEIPKRPLQTPQREWLRGPLKGWAREMIELACVRRPEWFQRNAVQDEWSRFERGESDNSFYIWQWISCGLAQAQTSVRTVTPLLRTNSTRLLRAA